MKTGAPKTTPPPASPLSERLRAGMEAQTQAHLDLSDSALRSFSDAVRRGVNDAQTTIEADIRRMGAEGTALIENEAQRLNRRLSGIGAMARSLPWAIALALLIGCASMYGASLRLARSILDEAQADRMAQLGLRPMPSETGITVYLDRRRAQIPPCPAPATGWGAECVTIHLDPR